MTFSKHGGGFRDLTLTTNIFPFSSSLVYLIFNRLINLSVNLVTMDPLSFIGLDDSSGEIIDRKPGREEREAAIESASAINR